ncbi:AbrB/MazE/SpoVT family DNA-binding domain-containing protein [Candidatus Pacearchaeota archaeon]|nr:AbrB/MazE/SpoVT family DNA-binding domain-containing protein [Candidatus Pacearchaeota archaeon]
MGISKITRNYQITLPKDVRKVAGLKEGDEVTILIEGDKITITKSEINPIMAAAGAWKGIKETGEEYQKRVRSEWKKREKRLDW